MLYSPDKFSYTITPAVNRSGVDLVLTRLETGEKKEFYLAGDRPDWTSLHEHMASLTDDLLTSFFVKGSKPKKEKKSESNS